MGKLKNLIDFLPIYFKDTDTHKWNGKGVLENFLEICGTYFEDIIVDDIEKTLDLFDIDHTPEIYLNYLWEFLGEIPFAYYNIVDKSKWDLYYNGFDTNLEKLAKASLWEIAKSGPVITDTKRIRELLKYSISLSKIRGTELFFKTVFRLYGINVTISDPYASATNGVNNANGWGNGAPTSDSIYYYDTQVTYDKYYTCNKCIPITVNFEAIENYTDINGNYFADKLSVIFDGKKTSVQEALELANDYNTAIAGGQEPPQAFCMFRKAMENFFYRYLPYYVKPSFTYNGVSLNDGVRVQVSYADNNHNFIIGEVDKVALNVSVTSGWLYTDLGYQVSMDNGSTYGNVRYDKIYYTPKPGTYKFRSVADNTQIATITIGETVINKVYNLNVTTSGTVLSDSSTITATIQARKIVTTDGTAVTSYPSLRIYAPDGTVTTLNPSGYTSTTTFNQAGTWRVEFSEFPAKYAEVEISQAERVFTITFDQSTITLSQSGSVMSASTIVHISSNYPSLDNDLDILCTGNNKIYHDGDTVTMYVSGTYTFNCVQDTKYPKDTARLIVRDSTDVVYNVSVSPSLGRITDSITSVSTVVTCSTSRGTGTNFNVECVETGEVYNCYGGHTWTFNTSGTFTLRSVADNTKTATFIVYESTTDIVNRLVISAVNPSSPGWTYPEPYTPGTTPSSGDTWSDLDSVTTRATYELQSTTDYCSVKIYPYLGGNMYTSQSGCPVTVYYRIANVQNVFQYEVGTTLNLTTGIYQFYSPEDGSLRCSIIVQSYSGEGGGGGEDEPSESGYTISCSPTSFNIVTGSGGDQEATIDEATTTVTCLNNSTHTHATFTDPEGITRQSPYYWSTSNSGVYMFSAPDGTTATFRVTVSHTN